MVLVASSKASLKRKSRVTLLMVLVTAVTLGLITLFISFGFYVDSLETIFPNVWAEGIEMSGMTKEQARQALIASGYEEQAAEISITVEMPYDLSFTVNGEEAGLRLDASEAVRAAYSFGREGSFFANELQYIRSLFTKTELNELSLPDYDTTLLRELAEEYAVLFNESLYDNDLEITDSRITIIKGTGYSPITADELYNFAGGGMVRAIEQHTHLTERFFPEANPDDSIDLASIFEYVHIEPVSSYYDPKLGNPELDTYDSVNKGATASKQGRTFDLAEAERRLLDIENGETIIIPIITLEPEISQAQLRNMLFRDVLCERVTSASSNADRAHNVRKASEACDGLIMQPGDVFSYNDIVGPRTQARGFRLANAFVGGETVLELGGGICQVSSTIYAALIQTDIEIVQKQAHGMRVAYLYGGQDATVAYGSIDFQFRNNTDYPIKLEVVTTGSVTVTVRIYGTRTEEIYYQIESIQAAGSPIEMEVQRRKATQEDLAQLQARGIDLKPGEEEVLSSGYTGQIWEVWRHHFSDPKFENPILDENGKPVSEMYGRPITYRMRPRVIVYRDGSSDEDRPPPAAPTNPPAPPPTEAPPPEEQPPPPEEQTPPPEAQTPPPEEPPPADPAG